MVNFIVVDDDRATIETVSKIISKVVFKYDISYKITDYQKYDQDLKGEINNIDNKKIYIMDIDLKNSKSGIKIAEEIRENDWESTIIFITSHDKMFDTVYRELYNIFDFIEKFNDFEVRLTKDISKIAKHNFDNKSFNYSIRNIDLHIPFKNINYIYRDSNERKLVINTDNNEYYVSMNVSEILNKLDYRFIRIHRSCIINKDVITKINWNKGYFEIKGNKNNLIYMASKKYKCNLK